LERVDEIDNLSTRGRDVFNFYSSPRFGWIQNSIPRQVKFGGGAVRFGEVITGLSIPGLKRLPNFLGVDLEQKLSKYRPLNAVEVKYRWKLHTEPDLCVSLAPSAIDPNSYHQVNANQHVSPLLESADLPKDTVDVLYAVVSKDGEGFPVPWIGVNYWLRAVESNMTTTLSILKHPVRKCSEPLGGPWNTGVVFGV
jgi:hypothetical protein